MDSLQKQGVRILEFRLDSFPEVSISKIASFAEAVSCRNLSILGTFRKNDDISQNRVDLFRELISYFDAIDIECEGNDKKELATLAQENRREILFSTHNFIATPEKESMEKVIEEAQEFGASIVKLAYFAQSKKDMKRLLDFAVSSQKKFPFIAWLSMGQWGPISRILAPVFGSVLAYGYIDKANADGQLSIQELHTGLCHFHPTYQKTFQERWTLYRSN